MTAADMPATTDAGDQRTDVALSIVIVRFAEGDAIDGSLRALSRQLAGGKDTEVIVAQHEGQPLPAASPHVRVVELPRGSGPARLRSHGVRASRGTIVAVTEDHCIPSEGWCDSIRAAHASGHDVVGGPIAPATWLAGRDLAFYLLAYARYKPPMVAGSVAHLSDCNVSYRRALLDNVRQVWAAAFVETDVHAALAARGVQLWLEPRALVAQGRSVDLTVALAEQREHGEAYARGRGARASFPGRLALLAGTLVLPALATARALARARGIPYTRIAGALPSFVRLALAWSAGERRGYLRAGAGA